MPQTAGQCYSVQAVPAPFADKSIGAGRGVDAMLPAMLWTR
jgi:hypothetical protein